AAETRAALTHLYDAFARRDGQAMAALYAPQATFEDPVFRLRGADIGRMWIALTLRAKEFGISYTIAQARSGYGTVEWTARYLFAGRRPVVNVVLSEIAFEGEKIVRQVDRFDFPRWAAQALGTPGRLFGRYRWFRRAVSRKAIRQLGIAAR
ncbi:MAG: nuclear transport factor 2 family protein, partial [Thermoanaerobaculia bacterium]